MAFVGDRLDRFAKDRPDRTALVCGPVHLSWAELVRRIDHAGAQLRLKSAPGALVVLRQSDPVALLICFFACARTGRIAVVMDSHWPQTLTASVLSEIAAELVIDDHAWSGFLASADLPPDRGGQVEAPPDETTLFYAGFTSGSSGVPKGYIRSHGSWLDSFELSAGTFGIDKGSRIVIPGQLVHSLHLYGAVCGLSEGHQVVLHPRFDPRPVLSALGADRSPAVLYATPTQLHLLADAARRSGHQPGGHPCTGPLHGVRQVLASGAKWRDADRRALAEVFPQARLFEFYGASETSFITIAAPEQHAPDGSVGKAARGVEIVIGDPAAPAPCGTSGAVWVRSPMLFSGYLCGGSRDTRWQDGWLTVGDHGHLDEDGFLFLTGRENRMIVTSGLNVYPEEVEAVLEAHPAVALAVVVGLPDALRGERLEAVVKLAAPLVDTERALLQHCKARLASGKVPRKVHVSEDLPLTAGGKPDLRSVLARLTREGADP